jgi:hypothetical protein
MRIGRVLIVVTGLLFAALMSSASAAVDVTGTQHIKQDIFNAGTMTSGPDEDDYTFSAQDTSGNFSGEAIDIGGCPITGKVTGSDIRFAINLGACSRGPSFAVYQGTQQTDGTFAGYGADCTASNPHAIQEMTWTLEVGGSMAVQMNPPTTVNATMADALCGEPLPGGVDFRHVTTTAVQCFRGAAVTDNSTCVATVTDTGSPPEPPAGGVNFAVAAGQGSLSAGTSCTLATSASNAATCQITFSPGPGGTPDGSTVPITASYAGNIDEMPSSADHGSLVAGAPPMQPPPTTTPTTPTAPTTPTTPVPLALTFQQCEDFANVPSNVDIPLGDYTGPDGAYGDKAARLIYCEDLSTLSLVKGGKWVTQTLAASLSQLDSSAKWVQNFPTFLQLPDGGWQEVAAQVHPWAGAQATAVTTGNHDPPTATYRTLAKATPATVPKIRVAGSARDRATASALNAWTAGLATSRGLADAFTLTVDRAGGAAQAGDKTWQGRQTRLAITFANALSTQDTRLVALTQKVAALATQAALAKQGLTTAQLQAIRTQIARHGLTKAQRARLKKLGYDATQLAAVVTAAKDKTVPTSQLLATPAKLLADPTLTSELQTFALYFHLWAHRPEVAAAAAL